MSTGLFNSKQQRLRIVIPFLIFILLVPLAAYTLFHILTQKPAPAPVSTVVSIHGTQFLINGQVPFAGSVAQGLLLNSRMIQGIFDDENPATVGKWAYPDTHRWDPQRNTNELVDALPTYARYGLKMITVGLQGGGPDPTYPDPQPWIVTAFHPDGSLKPAWMHRLDQVIRAANANGIVVDVSLFYWQQNRKLSSQQAVINGINQVTDWLLAGKYTNVLVEIANECDVPLFYPYLSQHVALAIEQVQTRSHGQLKVSASYTGGTLPPPSVVSQEDFIELHGNGLTPARITAMIDAVQAMPAYQAHPKPIVINEDSNTLTKLDAAVQSHVSWGYYDQGRNNYRDGFQSPPVDWRIDTPSKLAFFERVKSLTKSV